MIQAKWYEGGMGKMVWAWYWLGKMVQGQYEQSGRGLYGLWYGGSTGHGVGPAMLVLPCEAHTINVLHHSDVTVMVDWA